MRNRDILDLREFIFECLLAEIKQDFVNGCVFKENLPSLYTEARKQADHYADDFLEENQSYGSRPTLNRRNY